MPTPIPPTSFADLDAAVAALQGASERLARLPISERLQLLEHAAHSLQEVEAEWVATACQAKGIDPTTPQAGEEWLGGPMVTQRNIRLLRHTLADIRDYGKPQLPDGAVKVTSRGQTTARVFPATIYDKLLYTGFSAEVWMEPGITPENLTENMACGYRSDRPVRGKVALVLGAGNVASIGPMDVLYKLFAENEVCILKMNPVNEYVGPFVERAFRAMVEADFLRVVYGGADVGAYLCQHQGVDTIHITGSDKTHDAIVWGPPGEERERRRAHHEPLNTKPITSELGNVSPVIVVPGPWSESDLAFQAANIASMVTNNGSFNCNAAKLIVQHSAWDARGRLMDAVETTLRSAPPRVAYYPGADSRYDSFLAAHGEAKPLGTRGNGSIPWTVIRGVDSAKHDDICFTTEAFCGVLGETALDAPDTAAFIREAVAFVNDHVWGTLNACILIHPKSLKDPTVAAAFEDAVADLRYGTVGVNHWPAVGYALGVTTWGAFPGHTVEDIRSGRGVVHNTYLFDKPQKSVIRGPFRMSPKPPWFVTNKKTHAIGPRMSAFEASPSVLKLPGIIITALMG